MENETTVEMVVINGIRYRKGSAEAKRAQEAANKDRSTTSTRDKARDDGLRSKEPAKPRGARKAPGTAKKAAAAKSAAAAE